jgi:spermidine synthase
MEAMESRRRSDKRQRVHVRVTRRGRELRIGGTLASYYRRGHAMTGSVWDGLAAPLAALDARRVRRVLILGLGGGSAARAIRALAPQAAIVGVERERDVIQAAREWLDIDALRLEIVHADALHFLQRDRRRFDLVLDDVFLASKGAAWKPDWLPEPGLAMAARRLAAGGVLVSNTIDETAAVVRACRRLFPRVFTLRLRDYENAVVMGVTARLTARELRARMAARGLLSSVLPVLSIRAA